MATTTINLGLSLDGLSNVDSTGKNNGDILRWNSTTNKWEDNALPTTAPAGSNGQIQFNNSGAFGADSGLVWDNTNKRLGVGASPASTVRLDVRAQGALSTDIAFRVRNSANSANLLSVAGDGAISAVKATFATLGADNIMIWRRDDSGQSWILSNPGSRWSLANSGGNDITLSLNANSVDQNNKVGIGVVPTASLTIRAGTTTLAPLKLTSGTNLTTPENGAFEFDGTNLYFTVGGVRRIVSLI